jgi:Bacterial Ig-like domain
VQVKSRSFARRVLGYAGLILAAALLMITVRAGSASAALVMEAFPGGPVATDTTPTFHGSSSDVFDPVTVDIYQGETAGGEPVRAPTAYPSSISGSWSITVITPLEPGTYTAVAEQAELGGVGRTETSAPYTFTVVTMPPTVTLNQLPSRSNETTPSFSGTATGSSAVTVEVYRGASAQGNPVATLRAEVAEGDWVSASIAVPLAEGQYTAQATQPSSLDASLVGVSNAVTFEVDTEPPTVTLDQPASPSNDTAPTFSGTASETSPVTVEIFQGKEITGTPVATATAQGTGAGFTSEPATPALPRGKHTFTALATQPSTLQNPPGTSARVTFEVDTEPPAVKMNALPSPSNDTTPSFSGTASEAGPVNVKVFAGPKAAGEPVATAAATVSMTASGGSWISGHATPALGDGTYTALATEPSAIGNPAGTSTVTFTVDTAAPIVTMQPLPSPSANRAPSFSGTASDDTPVSVDIYRGASADGPVVASAEAEVVHGNWLSGRASPELQWGEYTAVATEPSSIGNPSGSSGTVTFAVEQIPPAVVSEAATEVGRASAALRASVDPDGAGVSQCYFEYGITPAYGTRIECGLVSEAPAFPPASTAALPVLARIFSLSPSTTYHFRIVAVGEGGTGVGADETFTTLPPFVFPEEGSAGRTASAPKAAASVRSIASGRLATLIGAQLVPHTSTATIAALLKSGIFKMRFKMPEAGRAVIDWYYRALPAKRTRKDAPVTILVASGTVASRAAATDVVTLHLTSSGRRLLARSSRLRLSASCTFKPVNGASVTASKTFELKR